MSNALCRPGISPPVKPSAIEATPDWALTDGQFQALKRTPKPQCSEKKAT